VNILGKICVYGEVYNGRARRLETGIDDIIDFTGRGIFCI